MKRLAQILDHDLLLAEQCIHQEPASGVTGLDDHDDSLGRVHRPARRSQVLAQAQERGQLAAPAREVVAEQVRRAGVFRGGAGPMHAALALQTRIVDALDHAGTIEVEPGEMPRIGVVAEAQIHGIRALVDGGFADLHHPEYWDLGFVDHSPLAAEYRKMVEGIGESLRFMETLAGQPIGVDLTTNRVDGTSDPQCVTVAQSSNTTTGLED